jgi:hypothetical protein
MSLFNFHVLQAQVTSKPLRLLCNVYEDVHPVRRYVAALVVA